jgi:hypothetical protein
MDLLALFKGFEKGCSNIARLNYVLITLIPKEEEARTLKKFSPISLINCSFKIFAKAMNIRLIQICDRLLSCNQAAFAKGRLILESVVSAHDIIHKAMTNNRKGLVLKLDYEKAYDKVSWHFLEEILVTRGLALNGLVE